MPEMRCTAVETVRLAEHPDGVEARVGEHDLDDVPRRGVAVEHRPEV
jgi:hypothetical protein